MNLSDHNLSNLGKLNLLIISVLLGSGLASSTMVINSDDWTDVTAGMQLADHNNQTPYFVQTDDGSAVMTETPEAATIDLYESTTHPYLDMENRFNNRGFNVNSTTSFDEQLNLVPDDVDDFVVISRSYSTSVVPALTYSNHIDGWTVVVDGQNIDDVEELLEDADGEVVKVGELTSSENDRLEEHFTDSIEGINRFDLSVNTLEKIEEENELERILLSDGTGLERDMFISDRPILLSGTNHLPEESREYIESNDDLSSVVVLGANLASIGENIPDITGDEQDVTVLLKFGQASPGGAEEEAVAISFYPLPLASIDLNILTGEYIPASDEFVVTFENPGELNVHKTSSITLVGEDGSTIETLDDESPQFIPSESTQVVTYDVDELNEENAENSEAEFVTSYGSNPSDLDSFVESREEGVFEPPRILPVSVLDIEDQSNIDIEQVAYNVDQEGFEVTASNIGPVDSYTRLRVDELDVDGVSQSFSSEVISLSPESSQSVFIPAELSEEDLDSNENVNIAAQFGERESFLIKSTSSVADLEAIEDRLTDSTTVVVILILIVLAVLYAVYRSL